MYKIGLNGSKLQSDSWTILDIFHHQMYILIIYLRCELLKHLSTEED